jgi:uncharacterized protein
VLRYLESVVRRDMARKMVLIAGPRQVGKSTLARSLLGRTGAYLNRDIRKDQSIIRNQAWRKDASLLVLDEIHKFPKWKNFLKSVADEFSNH